MERDSNTSLARGPESVSSERILMLISLDWQHLAILRRHFTRPTQGASIKAYSPMVRLNLFVPGMYQGWGCRTTEEVPRASYEAAD